VARKGNSRSPVLQMRVPFWEDFFMLQSRRGFLIGAGAVLTTAFVKDARSFIRQTSQPLLASPSQVVETSDDDIRPRLSWRAIPCGRVCASP